MRKISQPEAGKETYSNNKRLKNNSSTNKKSGNVFGVNRRFTDTFYGQQKANFKSALSRHHNSSID